MLVITVGFDTFENAKQWCSVVGIIATIRKSGSSARGRGRKSKVGNSVAKPFVSVFFYSLSITFCNC
jgi:hypothetical protein